MPYQILMGIVAVLTPMKIARYQCGRAIRDLCMTNPVGKESHSNSTLAVEE
jgi:hypothetical protein